MQKKILLLGNQKLYESSISVQFEQLVSVCDLVADLHDTLIAYRNKYGAGRAIAAPQIGVQLRVLYMFIDKPVTFINPSLTFPDNEMMEVMDDCMSFPRLKVRVHRHKRCTITYFDLAWEKHTMELEDDLAELLQHEYDHLDGILATMRAINGKAFYYVNGDTTESEFL